MSSEMGFIIAAGGIPLPSHPLYKHTQGKPEALFDVAGAIALPIVAAQ